MPPYDRDYNDFMLGGDNITRTDVWIGVLLMPAVLVCMGAMYIHYRICGRRHRDG